MAIVRADKSFMKADALDLAYLVGDAPAKRTTKKAALESIEVRHIEHARFLNKLRATQDADQARRLRQDESALLEGVAPGDVSGVEGLGLPETAPLGDRAGGVGAVRDVGRPDVERPGPAEGLPREGEGVGGGAVAGEGDRATGIALRESIAAEADAEAELRRDRANANYEITEDDQIGKGGAKAKVRANIAALL